MPLYQNGAFVWANMKNADIVKADIEKQLRLKLNTDNLDDVKEIYFERTGKESFVKKPMPFKEI